jgi:hypothetical protein
MPYFRMKLELNQAALANMRALPVRAQQNLKSKLATVLAPELQADTNDLMEKGPALVSPFEFGSVASAKKYFYMVDHGEVPFDGEHYIREGGPDSVQGGFRVEVSTTRFSIGMIQIRNLHPKGKFVFGPWLVAGHSNTGWPDHAELARQELRATMITRIVQLWREAVNDAAKGRDTA